MFLVSLPLLQRKQEIPNPNNLQRITTLFCQPLRHNMKVIFLATFLLIISGARAISNKDEDFDVKFTSENRSIIQSNEQPHNLLGTISLTFPTTSNLIFIHFVEVNVDEFISGSISGLIFDLVHPYKIGFLLFVNLFQVLSLLRLKHATLYKLLLLFIFTQPWT